jgi:hypothetical protein
MSLVDGQALAERFAGFTIASVLANRATSDSGRAYLRFHDRVLTYGEIERDAEALAAAFSNLGIEAGDRITLLLPPSAEFVVSMFAAAKLGATIVPLNPRLCGRGTRFSDCCARPGPRLLRDRVHPRNDGKAERSRTQSYESDSRGRRHGGCARADGIRSAGRCYGALSRVWTGTRAAVHVARWSQHHPLGGGGRRLDARLGGAA